MVDYDQGGVFRQTRNVILGPSIGALSAPDKVILTVSAAGVTQVPLGYTTINVSTASAVNLLLPVVKGLQSAISNPGTWVVGDLDIGDISGSIPSITITPGGTEKIIGRSSITIISAYGRHILTPDVINGGWTIKI